VNPDADLCADPEVDITKIGQPGPNGPTAPFSEDFYDEEQSMGKYWLTEATEAKNCVLWIPGSIKYLYLLQIYGEC